VRCAIEAAAGGAACWAALLLAAPAWLRAFAAHPRIAARWQLAALLLSSAVCLPLAYYYLLISPCGLGIVNIFVTTKDEVYLDTHLTGELQRFRQTACISSVVYEDGTAL
jgi:hypothetical protein